MRGEGGTDYGVWRVSDRKEPQLPIHDLKPGQWNHVVLDISEIPRQSVSLPSPDVLPRRGLPAQDGLADRPGRTGGVLRASARLPAKPVLGTRALKLHEQQSLRSHSPKA